MPFEIDLGNPIVGYVLSSAKRGESLPVVFREFTSTEDGQYFIERLESLPAALIDESPFPISRSQVDNLLAILRFDGSATVYLNEVPLDLSVRVRRAVLANEPASKDDISDIEQVILPVDIPDDAGFIYLFSIGWRKGIFYDHGPLRPDREPRRFDPSTLLGRLVTYVLYLERFTVTEREWEALFEQQWFLFDGLQNQTIANLLNHVRSGWSCDDMLDEIVAELRGRVPDMLLSWEAHPTLSTHIDFLRTAAERFLGNDPMSCTHILFPRIEGILRTHRLESGITARPSQGDLADSAVTEQVENDQSLLLPQRFKGYLEDVYFANFDLPQETIPLSRNSVGHGVAMASDFDMKSAVLGILIVHQLFRFLPRGG